MALLAWATGCGHGGPPPVAERPPAAGRVVPDELRSPDTRSPLVPGGGLWRCATPGRVELQISASGEATLSIAGRLLASVAPSRELVNRACERSEPRRLPALGTPRVVKGGGSIRCRAPAAVLVQFRDGDLLVRAAAGGRFLLGAAVSREHLDVAAYLAPGCAA